MEVGDRGEFSTFEHRTTGVLYFIAGALGSYVNLMTLLIFWWQKPLSGNKNMLHIQLALANIMVVMATPFSGLSAFNGKWLFGELGCRVYGLESYTGGLGAVTFASFLCIERFVATVWRDTYNAISTTSMFLVVVLGWLISITMAVCPFLGWNSYVIEESGTACGLDWRDDDVSFFKALLWMCSFLTLVAIFALWATFTQNETAAEANRKEEDEWFNEKQLNWIALANFVIVNVGFSPYGYFAFWTVFGNGQSMTMLASVIPPLSAKLSTIFCPTAYLVASKRFCMAYASKETTGKKNE